MATIKYTIPHIPPSLNKYAGRENTWEYRRDKKLWIDLIACYCRQKPREALKRVSVRILYYFPTKTRHDPDNYAGKFILDGLTHAGIIFDDSFDCIRLSLAGGYDKHNPRTEIEISEVEEWS